MQISSNMWRGFLLFVLPFSHLLLLPCWLWFSSNFKKSSLWLLPYRSHGLAMKFYVTPTWDARESHSISPVLQHQVLLYSRSPKWSSLPVRWNFQTYISCITTFNRLAVKALECFQSQTWNQPELLQQLLKCWRYLAIRKHSQK